MSTRRLFYQCLTEYMEKRKRIKVRLTNMDCYEGILAGIGNDNKGSIKSIVLQDENDKSKCVVIRASYIFAVYS